MEKPAFYLGQGYAPSGWAVNGEEKFISSRMWWIARAKGRGHQAIGVAQSGERDIKMDSIRGPASKHGAAIERKDTYAFEGPKGGTEKQVDREEIAPPGCGLFHSAIFG